MKILMNGYNGKMGKMIRKVYENTVELDLRKNITPSGDVIIDFSNHKAIEKLLIFSTEKKLPIVLCTTGYTSEELKMIEEASKKIPILCSYNTSLGINLIVSMLEKMPMLKEFDCEIIDIHHNKKKDKPSGTGILLKNAIGKEVPIHSLRLGNIVGEHKIIFSKDDETIELTHKAGSRKIFANGAIASAKFLLNKNTGLYKITDLW
ncbi:MAG: 4-hydroxy-tetrahydrodipicolinate reductase [Defluviitaleaceae bacterium]|nr:4-hydroxy-tetrahydrodipicolinate reductase [Defluviitaleaceae bacterium]